MEPIGELTDEEKAQLDEEMAILRGWIEGAVEEENKE